MSISNYIFLGILGILNTVTAAPAYENTDNSQYDNVEAASSYTLRDTYDYSNFFTAFNFITDADPTHGFVHYTSKTEATTDGLINTNNNLVYMGVDSKTSNPANGRSSVRVSSSKAYTHGLFIADIAHMPGDVCGVWPAWWLFGPVSEPHPSVRRTLPSSLS